jgi:hypothetical protein
MRAHCIRSTAALLFCLLFAPRPAHADLMSFWEWVDRMSGPGPWVGVVSEPNPFVCGATKTAVRDAGSKPASKDCVIDVWGNVLSQRDFHIRFGPQIGFLKAVANDLDYGGAEAPSAKAFVFGVTVDAGAKGVEFGVAYGGVHFFGKGFGFTKPTIQPRLTVYPLIWLKKKDPSNAAQNTEYTDRLADAVYVRIGANRIFGEISAADFGAVSAPEKMGDEWLWSITISVNPFAFKN